MTWRNRTSLGALAALTLVFVATPAPAQKRYDPGVTDREIKIGTTTPQGNRVKGCVTNC